MMEEKRICSCGRSKDGSCDGSHKLTNEQYAAKLAETNKLTEQVLLKEAM